MTTDEDTIKDEDELVSFIREKSDEGDLDMTPMVDVTFLLLIFFVMTAAFTIQTSLPIPTPQSEEASTQSIPDDKEEDPEFITVKVDADNVFWVMGADGLDTECANVKDLRIQMRLTRTDLGDPDKLIVEANEEALHSQVIAAIDAGMVIGVDQVQLMTVQEDNINY
ncbi:MAG: biopolymer transporter ExbD [Planctomycetota bacterium]|nr:biopolymer transporter ExbD [Planctomycetota bacterium]